MFVNRIKICSDLHKLLLWFSRSPMNSYPIFIWNINSRLQLEFVYQIKDWLLMHALTLSTYITVLSTVIEITQASYVLSFLNTQNQLIILRLSDTYTARTALVEKKKGLGVTITNKLTRNSHIHNIVDTSNKLKQMFLYKKIERQCR
jgi:hypothetical protein